MNKEVRYAGFFVRLIASLIDLIILTLPISILIYFLNDNAQVIEASNYQEMIQYAQTGNTVALIEEYKKLLINLFSFSTWDMISFFIFMFVAVVFWKKFDGATPGKKILKIKVVDSEIFGKITNTQAITRSFGYIPATLFFGIGILMVAFRKDKRGLHDLLAGTAVIHDEDKK